MSNADELKKLKELLDSGVLSNQEPRYFEDL